MRLSVWWPRSCSGYFQKIQLQWSCQTLLPASLHKVGKAGKNSRQQGKRELTTGGSSVCLCEHGAGSLRKELLGEIKCGQSPSMSSERSLRLCLLSLQKGLWGCQCRIGHRFKINKGAKAIIYLEAVEKPAHSKPGCHLWRWNELSSGTLNGNNKSSLRLCAQNE